MPHDGVMSDLMWSDPEESIEGFSLSPRGAGLLIYIIYLDMCSAVTWSRGSTESTILS